MDHFSIEITGGLGPTVGKVRGSWTQLCPPEGRAECTPLELAEGREGSVENRGCPGPGWAAGSLVCAGGLCHPPLLRCCGSACWATMQRGRTWTAWRMPWGRPCSTAHSTSCELLSSLPCKVTAQGRHQGSGRASTIQPGFLLTHTQRAADDARVLGAHRRWVVQQERLDPSPGGHRLLGSEPLNNLCPSAFQIKEKCLKSQEPGPFPLRRKVGWWLLYCTPVWALGDTLAPGHRGGPLISHSPPQQSVSSELPPGAYAAQSCPKTLTQSMPKTAWPGPGPGPMLRAW